MGREKQTDTQAYRQLQVDRSQYNSTIQPPGGRASRQLVAQDGIVLAGWSEWGGKE